MREITRIINETYNPAVEVGDAFVKPNLINKDGSYHKGQWREFVVGNFSLTRAIETLGYVEGEPTEFFENGKFGDGILGISTANNDHFCINEKSIYWQVTTLHEVGHIFLNHDSFKPEIVAEIEANLFAYFCAKILGFGKKGDFLLIGSSLNFYNEHEGAAIGRGIPDFEVDHIKQRAEAFIRVGCGGEDFKNG